MVGRRMQWTVSSNQREEKEGTKHELTNLDRQLKKDRREYERTCEEITVWDHCLIHLRYF